MNQTITGISSMATRQILRDLAVRYEAETGSAVAIEAMGGVPAADAVRGGRATDIVILASGPMGKLEAEGHLVPGQHNALRPLRHGDRRTRRCAPSGHRRTPPPCAARSSPRKPWDIRPGRAATIS